MRLRQPPSSFTGELASYLYDVARTINAIPQASYFSGRFPSDITGVRGNIAVNASSLGSVLFVHYGSLTVPDKTSWNTVA